MAFVLTSNAFRSGERIPTRHTCDGQDLSPPLTWTGAPAETRSLALICEDPDAPRGTFTHWVWYGLSAETRELPEDYSRKPGAGVLQGRNDFGKTAYGGPCPPAGRDHRYIFRLYALDAALDLPSGLNRAQLLDRMRGHALDQAELMGRYSRS